MTATVRACAALTLLALVGSSCGTTATIAFRSGATQEAEIVGGNSNELLLATNEGRHAVRRADVTDIDHPGNVMAVIGSGLIVAGVLSLTTPILHCHEGYNAFCLGWAGGTLSAVSGAIMTGFGYVRWHGSTSAAQGSKSVDLSLAPVIWNQQGDRRLGAAAALRF